MSKNSINPIGAVQPLESGASAQSQSHHAEAVGASKPGAPAQAKAAAPTQVEALAQVETAAAAKPAAQPDPKPTKVDEKTALPVSNGSDLTIHFKIDEDTKDLTVFIVDRESKRVLRSIPSDELNKLSAGDLLKLTA